ncbi:MAG: hypothetical protein KAW17_09615 [Candidatus Eisenbacteria sp.]|nr:hypothetical protein [Candidatus Eisenbacteria bacterium]
MPRVDEETDFVKRWDDLNAKMSGLPRDHPALRHGTFGAWQDPGWWEDVTLGLRRALEQTGPGYIRDSKPKRSRAERVQLIRRSWERERLAGFRDLSTCSMQDAIRYPELLPDLERCHPRVFRYKWIWHRRMYYLWLACLDQANRTGRDGHPGYLDWGGNLAAAGLAVDKWEGGETIYELTEAGEHWLQLGDPEPFQWRPDWGRKKQKE